MAKETNPNGGAEIHAIGEKLSQKEMQQLREFFMEGVDQRIDQRVDQRVHENIQHYLHHPEALGIKLPQPETMKDKLARAGVIVGTVAAAVVISYGITKMSQRKEAKKLELQVDETTKVGDGNRVRPVGRHVTAQLNN